MTVDPVSINTLLAKLDAARTALGHFPGDVAAATQSASAGKPVDFASVLKNSLAQVDETQQQAMGLAERFQLGDSKVTLEETMVSLSKANVSFQQMVQVRNRVVAAYHDVMNLQI